MNIKELIGKTLLEIKINEHKDEIFFNCNDGTKYRMLHYQYCSERVTIDDINGNLNDLLGTPIVIAEESSNFDESERSECSESFTWTFYKFATLNGYVDIKWYGESNGYYSERVDFEQII